MKNYTKYNPLISIIMPVYNAGGFLMPAIQSILSQTYTNWELIAVDDGSTDGSTNILDKFAAKDTRIRVFKNSHKGLPYALNTGLKKTRGQFIARMDADDLSHPKRLETQLKFLNTHRNVILVGTQVQMIDEAGRRIARKTFPLNHEKIYEMMMTMMPVQHATILARAPYFKKTSYQNHTTAEDVSLMFKLIRLGRFANTHEILYSYRLRENSNSHKNVKKTFYLTLKSRVKAVIEWDYKPSVKSYIINIAELILISLIPEAMVMKVYKFLRFNGHYYTRKITALKDRIKKMPVFKKTEPAYLVK